MALTRLLIGLFVGLMMLNPFSVSTSLFGALVAPELAVAREDDAAGAVARVRVRLNDAAGRDGQQPDQEVAAHDGLGVEVLRAGSRRAG